MWKIKYITTTDYDGVYMKLKQVKYFSTSHYDKHVENKLFLLYAS